MIDYRRVQIDMNRLEINFLKIANKSLKMSFLQMKWPINYIREFIDHFEVNCINQPYYNSLTKHSVISNQFNHKLKQKSKLKC